MTSNTSANDLPWTTMLTSLSGWGRVRARGDGRDWGWGGGRQGRKLRLGGGGFGGRAGSGRVASMLHGLTHTNSAR